MPIIDFAEAERRLAGVRSVALGGMLLEGRPAALVRALIRAGARDLFVCSAPAASWDLDVLIAAGRVRRSRIPHISFGSLGMAPAARAAFEAGTVHNEVCDEALLLGGYLAANHNAPIQVLDSLGVNDVVTDNPLLVHAGDLVGVGPLRVDVALLHAPAGDADGNLVLHGSRWADVLMARSAATVIAQVDRVVSAADAARLGVRIPGHLVDAVVEAPFGAHPLGSVGSYVADLEHLAAYREQVLAGKADRYVAEHCEIGHAAYVERLDVGLRRELERQAS